MGAMLRSAYCLGVSGVLACSRNCAPLSPVVSKSSAGAMELMRLHSCRRVVNHMLCNMLFGACDMSYDT